MFTYIFQKYVSAGMFQSVYEKVINFCVIFIYKKKFLCLDVLWPWGWASNSEERTEPAGWLIVKFLFDLNGSPFFIYPFAQLDVFTFACVHALD